MIKVNKLIYEYPDYRVLNKISFTIPKGSITALKGTNGTGKTTLIECIAGIRKPFSGEIIINGIDTQKNPRVCNKYMGFLPTFYGLYDKLTVRQNLTYYAYANKIKKGEVKKQVEKIGDRLQLSAVLEKKIGTLSRGYRQLTALAQALIHDPQLLLLEKPTTGLDPQASENLIELLRELNQNGVTIVVSCHILSELDNFASDYLHLENGGIKEFQKQ